ncbi:MAG TPA: sigma-70 family RNA polymerase sigma factor [Planctomycetota bacterium]|nr:sigma-70 family RNA polymerase sigma factor [Planctomycetota bacterium]
MDAAEIDRLIARVRAGEVPVYAEIVRACQADVWRVVVGMLRDGRAAEDLVQQAFVNAYEHLDRYRPGADFGAWIKAIARNLVRLELRSRAREDRRLAAYHDLVEARLDDPAAEARDAEMGEALRRCRELVPPPAAEALSLRYDQGRDFEDVARSLGRTVEATRQLLARVRAALRDCIQKRLAQS